jgi:hypothetical protein
VFYVSSGAWMIFTSPFLVWSPGVLHRTRQNASYLAPALFDSVSVRFQKNVICFVVSVER